MRVRPTTHRWTRRRMSAYLDGQLGAGARRRLERHLDGCPDCRRTLGTLVALLLALPTAAERAGPKLPDRILEHVWSRA